MPRAWYIFNGATNADAQYAAGNYRLISHSTRPACINGIQVCAVSAAYPGDVAPINPIAPLSANIKQYIADGLATQVSQPQIPTDTKRYVYLRTII
jgi:hypothetical protein